ncbi:MAG TPA: hypothetical protein VGX28_08895 [Frankiaceae bacterium]|jgi:hypothetical protein|nr:hypothetical protein [Frankiaceae bacterium]
MSDDGEVDEQDQQPYVLYFEDARGALLFNDQCLPYVLYAARDGGVHVVDAGREAAELREAVVETRPEVRARRGLARRDARRRRRHAIVGAVAAAASTVGFVIAPGLGSTATAQEKAAKVLQAVDIELGADGTLTAVTSNDVRNTDGEPSSKRIQLDPAKVASGLPVRVLTSYVHDGKTGTDLKDLKGVRGRVQVTVTVQNATVHAEKLTYDVAGERRDQYALIGTPLTVTASAVLPKSGGELVMPSRAGGSATNGVVGRTEDGEPTVQWVALLAPPRLASSASFTLVQDATDFALPELDLTVQPGLVTDLSLDRLIREAFRKDGTSQLSLENKTIVLISTVNRVLGDATQTLSEIERALSHDADTLGSRLIHQLAASSTQLTGAAGDLSLSLEQLDASLRASVAQTRDENVTALQKTVATLSDYIGHPDDEPIKPLPVTPGCAISTKGAKKATTLYGQLKNVSQQLLTLQSATKACTDTIKAALDESLGDPAQCAAGWTSAACTLVTTKAQLQDVASYVATAGGALLVQFDPTAVDGVRAALEDVTGKVVDVQKASAKLNAPQGGTQAASLKTQLEAISAALGTVIAGVDSGGTGLAASLGTLNDLADDHRQAIGGDAAAGSMSAQLAAAAAAVCDTPAALSSGDAETTAYLDTLRAILVGTSCAKGGPAAELPLPAAYPTPLADRLALEYQAWTTVAALTDVESPAATGPAREAHDLADGLRDLRDDIDAVVAALGDTGDGLGKKIETLQAKIAALYTPVADSGCLPADATSVPPLNALELAFTKLECNQEGLSDNLSALLASATPTYDKAAADVGSAATTTNSARLGAAAALDDLLGTLNTSLSDTAARSVGEGGTVIRAQQATLADQEEAFVAKLDAATRAALGDIGTSISQSNRLLTTSTDLLKKGLESLQLDLGEGGATPHGLLGVVSSSGRRTGAAAERVGDASGQAGAFGRVRGTEVEEVLLQQAQLTRAFELQAVFSAFALDLPAGSTSSVVFSFHLEGV